MVPSNQPDSLRTAQMLNRLMTQHIEVSRAPQPFQVKEGSFPAGSYVIRLDQPYRNYAVDLLVPQEFPNDAEHAPYDDISWALPVHYGVDIKKIDDAAILKVPVDAVTQELHPAGQIMEQEILCF